MSTFYCTNCGAKHEYSYAKPNFCGSCGNKTSTLATQNNTTDNASINRKALKTTSNFRKNEIDIDDKEDDFEEEESDIHNVPQLSKLDYEIETFASAGYKKVATLGLILGQTNEMADSPFLPKTKTLEDLIGDRRI